jgi:hypothetical protein
MKMTRPIDSKLSPIIAADDLVSLNDQLTAHMKNQQIQGVIRNENLGRVTKKVMLLSSNASAEQKIFAAAILGRLAAVARGREMEVYSHAPQLLLSEPISIENLSDGDEKEYAAKMIGHSDADWLTKYCARESLKIDSANNARKELLRVLVNKSGNLAHFFHKIIEAQSVLNEIEQVETRLKRVRRIFEGMAEVVRNYDGDIGQEPGAVLESLFERLMYGAANADPDAIYPSFEASIIILVRIIELRFSHALHAETYSLLQKGKRLFSQTIWNRFLESSIIIQKVQMTLLETALVLARQNRTDKEILRVMEASWPSHHSVTSAIKKHFVTAVDIDPGVADYWLKLGRVSQSERVAEHKLGNTEDQQIGELLIQLDANRENMNKLNRAVVPVLETFDPIQAATVRRAANGYESIAQVAERLARMRKLSKTDLLAKVVEYNPIEHDMEGGHRSGIRKVKVVRDGIMKEFGDKKKTLVKPRVEPEE